MRTAASLIRALGRSHTYNPRRNPTLVLGLAWGCAVGFLSLGFAACAAGVGAGRDPSSISYGLGLLLFLAHPVVFGIVAGALGTVCGSPVHTAKRAGRSSGVPSAIVDPSTGLYSAPYMLDQIRQALARSARSREPVTLIILEPDRAGDDPTLCLLAESARPFVREGDALGRIGEGRLLLLAYGSLPCAVCLTERMSGSLYGRAHLKLKAGVARWPQDGRATSELLDAAGLVLKASWAWGHDDRCPRAPADLRPFRSRSTA